MALAPGTRVGVYEIVSLLGAGGMGEVYRALDTNLKREVAIKVLPTSLAEDAKRLDAPSRPAWLVCNVIVQGRPLASALAVSSLPPHAP